MSIPFQATETDRFPNGFRPFPKTRPIKKQQPMKVSVDGFLFPQARRVDADHLKDNGSPENKRYPTTPRHVVVGNVKEALLSLKEDLDSRHQNRNDQKAELYIAQLLREDVLAPVRKMRKNRGSHPDQQKPIIDTPYPLHRKDAKKRKESRFRVKVEKSSLASIRQREENALRDSNFHKKSKEQQIRELKRKLVLRKKNKHEQKQQTLLKNLSSMTELFSCVALSSASMACTPLIARCTGPNGVGSFSERRSAPNVGDISTKVELLRLKRELNQLQRMASVRGNDEQASLTSHFAVKRPQIESDDETQSSSNDASTTSKDRYSESKEKRVRFAAPLVTKVKHRPYTEPEEMQKLYFAAEELDDFELDRESVPGDQLEVRLVGHNLQVEYVQRAVVEARRRSDELMLSPSDLSALADDDDVVLGLQSAKASF